MDTNIDMDHDCAAVIAENIAKLRDRIKTAARSAGRNESEITLVGVTKTIDTARIKLAMQNGIADLGENRVQEYMDKAGEIGPDARWHLIGHLQQNKAKYVAGKVALIHSVDSLELAEQISSKAAQAGAVQNILIQVNVSREETKSGIELDHVEKFIIEARKLQNIRIKGMMTIAPLTDDRALVAKIFAELYKKYIDIKGQSIDNVDMEHLSMGMSNDFETAIMEGANMVRIGTAIFGARI